MAVATPGTTGRAGVVHPILPVPESPLQVMYIKQMKARSRLPTPGPSTSRRRVEMLELEYMWVAEYSKYELAAKTMRIEWLEGVL